MQDAIMNLEIMQCKGPPIWMHGKHYGMLNVKARCYKYEKVCTKYHSWMKTKCVMHVCASRGTYSPNVDVNVTHFKSGLHDMQLTNAMRCSP